jgi:biofilm protein TabA
MIFDKIANFRTYSFGESWNNVFHFLNSLDLDCEEKRYELADGMFAMIETSNTRPKEAAKLESHQKYVDIQIVLSGAESIAWCPVDELDIETLYDEESDVEFYQLSDDSNGVVRNLPGFFAVFWPNDAHAPLLQVDNIAQVKKVVIKIPVSNLPSN